MKFLYLQNLPTGGVHRDYSFSFALKADYSEKKNFSENVDESVVSELFSQKYDQIMESTI